MIYRSRAVATFSAVAKALAGRVLWRSEADYVDTTIGELTKVRMPCIL